MDSRNEPPPASVPAPQRWTWKFRITLVLLAMLVLAGGMTVWYMAPAIRARWNSGKARELAVKGAEMIKAGEVETGYLQLVRAYQKSPSEPYILRQLADLFDKVPSGVDQAVHFRRLLVSTGTANWEDEVALAWALLRQDSLEQARKLFEALPPGVSKEIKVVELKAALLDRDGKSRDAQELRSELWAAHPEDPGCRLKLAGVNIGSPFGEISSAAEEVLWIAIRIGDENSAPAMVELKQSGRIRPSNCEEFLRVASASTALSDSDAYAIFDACVDISPSLQSMAIEAARSRLKPGRQEARDVFYQWLSRYSQPETILKEVTETEAVRSRILLLAYSDALLRTGRYDDLDRVLKLASLPLSKVDAALLRAFISRAHHESDEALRTQLRIAEMQASLAHDEQALRQMAAAAESFNFPDISITAYLGRAENRGFRLDSYKRIFKIQKERHDSRGMLEAAEQILAERPALPPYADQTIYLKLMAGIRMEEALGVLLEAPKTDETTPLTQLNYAIASYYAGDLAGLKRCLPDIKVSALEPGQRAVASALMAAAGLTQQALSLSQTLTAFQLLPDESAFLAAVRE